MGQNEQGRGSNSPWQGAQGRLPDGAACVLKFERSVGFQNKKENQDKSTTSEKNKIFNQGRESASLKNKIWSLGWREGIGHTILLAAYMLFFTVSVSLYQKRQRPELVADGHVFRSYGPLSGREHSAPGQSLQAKAAPAVTQV